jgi:uncharacterized protein YukE
VSLVGVQVNVHERHQGDRRRVRMQMESMWSDSAARKYLDVVDELDQADREYGHALTDLDTTFDQADKLLGPIP